MEVDTVIKVFTTGKDGKISLTPEELKALLDEAYLEGFRKNYSTWTYTTPWTPYVYTSTGSNATITLNGDAATSDVCINNSGLTVGLDEQ